MDVTDAPDGTSQQGSRWAIVLPWVVTISFSVMAVAYCVLRWSYVRALEPNEVGDSLAGFFAPIAAIWLIAGFHQQAKELRLQVKELVHQVAATNRIADDHTRRAREEIRAAQPVLQRGGHSLGSGRPGWCEIRCVAGEATNLRIGDVLGDIVAKMPIIKDFHTSSSVRVEVVEALAGFIELRYLDSHLRGQSRWLHYSGIKNQSIEILSIGLHPTSDTDPRRPTSDVIEELRPKREAQ